MVKYEILPIVLIEGRMETIRKQRMQFKSLHMFILSTVVYYREICAHVPFDTSRSQELELRTSPLSRQQIHVRSFLFLHFLWFPAISHRISIVPTGSNHLRPNRRGRFRWWPTLGGANWRSRRCALRRWTIPWRCGREKKRLSVGVGSFKI